MSIANVPKTDPQPRGDRPVSRPPRVTTPATKPIPVQRTAGTPRHVLRKLVLAAIVVSIGGIGWYWYRGDSAATVGELIYHAVQRTNLEVKVTERGNLESQVNVEVVCEVDDIGGDNINGTPIVWIVDNGASVKQGDLIVELDATGHQERLDIQELDVEEERAEFIQAEVQFENQKTQNLTTLAEAQLAVQLAELALQQFGDEEAGTFQLNLQDVELQIQEAEAGQLIEQTNLQGVETLYKLGYRSSGELAEARLNALRADRQLATAMSRKRELVEYELKKSRLELEGARDSAVRACEQVRLDNAAKLAQADARLASAREQLAKEEELLKRYREQISKCKIYAPQDGMVAYHVGSSRYRREEIRAGAEVRPRQTILTLPNLTKMQVKTAVHESVLDQIRKGLEATVRVDAFPDVQYRASVATVAVLPDQGGWLSSDTKVYETVVTIDEEVEQLKPGMTAVVEINAARVTDVIAVPVQSIVQIEGNNWVYVNEAGRPVRRCVTLGLTNSKFVEVRDGLQEGEQIVLNPSAISDSSKVKASPSEETEQTEQQPEEELS